jgi:hypothetical protein
MKADFADQVISSENQCFEKSRTSVLIRALRGIEEKRDVLCGTSLLFFGNAVCEQFCDVSPDIGQAVMSQAALSPPSRSVTAALMRSIKETG